MPTDPLKRRPRTAGDRDRYLRRFGRTVQAWPVLDGKRVYLGSFPDEASALRAIEDCRAGRLPPRPPGVRVVNTRGGKMYRVDLTLPDGLRVQSTLVALDLALELVERLRAVGARPTHSRT